MTCIVLNLYLSYTLKDISLGLHNCHFIFAEMLPSKNQPCLLA